MRIGMNGTALVQRASVERVIEHALQAERAGFSSYWLAEHPSGGFDALTVLALVGQQVQGIELGTAIVPSMPRHPMVLAGQATTVSNAIGGRLALGIGLSHAPMMAELGIGFDKPIRHLREYLSILIPLLREGRVAFDGETLSCHAKMFRKPDAHCPVIVAALGPQALKVAGAMADGTTLAWVGPKTIAEHIVPRIREAADAAQRAAPRVIATLPVCVTKDPAGVRAVIDRNLAMYGELPSYRAMFEREGARGPGDVAIVGSEAEVKARIADLAGAGVTDFAVSEFTRNDDERHATRAALTDLL